MTPALPIPALATWIRHTLDGESLREIARGDGVAPSSAMRRAARIEALSDCPGWSLVLETIVEAARSGSLAGLTVADLLGALGTDPAEVRTYADRLRIFAPSAILLGDMPNAVLIVGERKDPLPRAVALGFILLGLAEFRAHVGPALRLGLTGADLPPAEGEEPRPDPALHPFNILVRRRWELLGEAEVAAGQHLMEMASLDPLGLEFTLGGADISPHLVDLLRLVFCEGVGLETVERRLDWPARSAKLALAIALGEVARKGVA